MEDIIQRMSCKGNFHCPLRFCVNEQERFEYFARVDMHFLENGEILVDTT